MFLGGLTFLTFSLDLLLIPIHMIHLSASHLCTQVFVHGVAGLRALVRGSEWADKITIHYDKLLSRGRVIQGEVVDGKLRTLPPPFFINLIISISTYVLPLTQYYGIKRSS